MSRRRTKAEEIRNPEHYFNRYVACERKKEQEEDAEYYNLHCSLDELSEQAAAGFNHDFAYFFSVTEKTKIWNVSTQRKMCSDGSIKLKTKNSRKRLHSYLPTRSSC